MPLRHLSQPMLVVTEVKNMSSFKRSVPAGAAALGALALAVTAAHAGVLEFDFLPANTFSGTAPAGTLTAIFTDVAQGTCGGSGGCVQLVITSNLGSNENLDPGKALYLNIDPAKSSELGSLAFTLAANTGFSQAAGVATGEDGFKPDGDGLMDILFTYTSGTKAFTTGESQTYDISTALGTISAADFDFSSTCGNGCGTGSHLAAVHVQNTPNGGEGSAFVGGTIGSTPAPVPEPATLALLGTAMLGFGALRRRQRS
jgi:PEP-CTERM motif